MGAEDFYKEHFGHTSQHVSMDKIFVCMELYAKQYTNQRVIEELEMQVDKYFRQSNTQLDLSKRLKDRIAELKQER
jgi:hypothetical protein